MAYDIFPHQLAIAEGDQVWYHHDGQRVTLERVVYVWASGLPMPVLNIDVDGKVETSVSHATHVPGAGGRFWTMTRLRSEEPLPASKGAAA